MTNAADQHHQLPRALAALEKASAHLFCGMQNMIVAVTYSLSCWVSPTYQLDYQLSSMQLRFHLLPQLLLPSLLHLVAAAAVCSLHVVDHL